VPDQADVEVVNVEAVTTAVIPGPTTREQLSAAIGERLGPVWDFVRATGDLQPNNSVVVYFGNPDDGAEIEVGVRVGRTFDPPPDSPIVCSSIPAGRVVRAVNRGPYSQMHPTYQAIEQYIRDNDLTVIGPSWEIYGDWVEDESQLETEIVFRIA
jgi:effector-binding domain-containing protein